MSTIKEHTQKSLASIKASHPALYKQNQHLLEKMLLELHQWFDAYSNQKTDVYDYTGINCLKHREQRHHLEGIVEAAKIFSQKYGLKFKAIIESEARQHVLDDMGQIYFADDYNRIGFWKEIRGF